MRFLVDECTGPAVARWLESQGYEVFSVYDEARGATDEEILHKALAEEWLLITNDKDFGERIYRDGRRHRGVVFLRLSDERAARKLEVIERLLAAHVDALGDRFTVVTETHVRFARS